MRRILEYKQNSIDELKLLANWKPTTEYLNGNAKLVATYKNKETGEKVVVTPFKTYERAGFCNAHNVVYRPDDTTFKTVAKGLENCEHPEDARNIAVEKIQEVLE